MRIAADEYMYRTEEKRANRDKKQDKIQIFGPVRLAFFSLRKSGFFLPS